jgi:hypothetical protein
MDIVEFFCDNSAWCLPVEQSDVEVSLICDLWIRVKCDKFKVEFAF